MNLYLILDSETATMPHAMKYEGNFRKKIAIAKPLIYDLGWKIIDETGKVYERKSFLISEIFSVPSIFNTAYYSSKRPQYLEKIRKKEISVVPWDFAIDLFMTDLEKVVSVGAYNSMFDFKKALKFTEEYTSHLYSEDYYEWENKQNAIIDYMVENNSFQNPNDDFDQNTFTFRSVSIPLFDIWGLSCKYILNSDEYRSFCHTNGYVSASGKYYKTSAETTYQFITKNETFEESHTAIEDCDIECQILTEIFKKVAPNEMPMGIIYFPFRMVGRFDM